MVEWEIRRRMAVPAGALVSGGLLTRDGTDIPPACFSSDQILPGDDFTKAGIVGDELLDEFVHAALEDVVHVRVLQPVPDAAGVALRRALAAIGDADLVEIADQI